MFLYALLVVGYTSSSFSQDIDPMAVGVFVAGKASTNVSTAKVLFDNSFAVAPVSDFGVTGYIPLSKRKNMGVLLDVGMSSYSYTEKLKSDPSKEDSAFTHKYSYLTIGPSFTASYITFGFNLGLPMGVIRKNGSGTEITTIDGFRTLTSSQIDTTVYSDEKDNLKTTLEIRVGAMVPVLKTSLGRLNVFANAGYMISNILKDEYFKLPSLKDANPSIFSFSIGVNFLFALEKPEEE